MARRKETSANRRSKRDILSSSRVRKSEPIVESALEYEFNEKSRLPRSPLKKLLLGAILLLALGLVLWSNKGLIVAATVNNQPIWRWQFEERIISRYGSATLEDLVNEQIIKSEAQRRGITISDKEVNDKVAESEKSLQGRISLKDALSQRGMTMDDLRNGIKLQLMLDKMISQSITVTDKEISEYIEKNKDFLQATDEAGLKTEARNSLLSDKRRNEYNRLFEDLKKKAKVIKLV